MGFWSMRKLLVCSDLALYSPFKKVVYLLSKKYNIESHVIYPKEHTISPVYLSSKFDGEHELDKYISFYALSGNSSHAVQHGFNPHELKHLLGKISPDYIWLHVEITEGLPLQFLWHYRFNRHPRIIAYFAANHLQGPRPVISSRWPFVSRGRIKQLLLWPRLRWRGSLCNQGPGVRQAHRLAGAGTGSGQLFAHVWPGGKRRPGN